MGEVDLIKERTVYLKLILMPLGFLLVLNAIFQFLPYSRLNIQSWIYILPIVLLLGVIYAYATYRIGKALDFDTREWLVSAALFLVLFWGSFIYILFTVSRSINDHTESDSA